MRSDKRKLSIDIHLSAISGKSRWLCLFDEITGLCQKNILLFLAVTIPCLTFAAPIQKGNLWLVKMDVSLAHIDLSVGAWVTCRLLDDKQKEVAKGEKQVPVKGSLAASGGNFPMQVPINLPASVPRQQVRQVRCNLEAEYLGTRETPSLHAKHSWAAAGDGRSPVTGLVKDIRW